MMRSGGRWDIFSAGWVRKNVILVLLIGLCPALACSGTVRDGFGMGVAATFVLVCSNFVISVVRRWIPHQIRIPIFILVISTFVTIVDYLMQAFFPSLYAVLGIFVPLIVVNCMILGRAEAFAYRNGVLDSVLDGFGMGGGFTLVLAVLGAIRELLGNGTLLAGTPWEVHVFGARFEPMVFMVLPPGAFLGLGFMLGAVNFVRSKRGRVDHGR